jgi:hypothetical protein
MKSSFILRIGFKVGSLKLRVSRQLTIIKMKPVPVIVVFTQYDRLVRTKRFELEEKVDPTLLDQESKQEAQKAFASCEQSLEMTVRRLEIPMPQYMPVSGTNEYSISCPSLIST